MKRRLLTFGLLALLLVAAVTAWHYRARLLPHREAGEIFLRYRDIPGIDADYIKNFRINDTLCLDMTLFEAEDSLAFATLLKDWGKSDEYIHDIMTHYFDKNTRYIKLHPKGHPELPKSKIKTENEIVATFPVIRTILVFHTQTEQAIDQIVYSNLREEIRISNILKAKENEQSN